jgi:hypothetical protein
MPEADRVDQQGRGDLVGVHALEHRVVPFVGIGAMHPL